MQIESNQEIQKSVKQYSITLLSGEIISLNRIISEDIGEERDGYTNISLNSATYSHSLYEAFKNKELVQCIVKKSINVDICDLKKEIIEREFIYDSYFKINEFSMSGNMDYYPTYTIEFQSI